MSADAVLSSFVFCFPFAAKKILIQLGVSSQKFENQRRLGRRRCKHESHVYGSNQVPVSRVGVSNSLVLRRCKVNTSNCSKTNIWRHEQPSRSVLQRLGISVHSKRHFRTISTEPIKRVVITFRHESRNTDKITRAKKVSKVELLAIRELNLFIAVGPISRSDCALAMSVNIHRSESASDVSRFGHERVAKPKLCQAPLKISFLHSL